MACNLYRTFFNKNLYYNYQLGNRTHVMVMLTKDKYRYLCILTSKILLANQYKSTQEARKILQENFVPTHITTVFCPNYND